MALPGQFISEIYEYQNNGPLSNIPGVCRAIDNRGRSVVIKTWNSNEDVHGWSFSISQGLGVYFLQGLDRFVAQNDQGDNLNCYAYEDHVPLNSWMQTKTNVVLDNRYTKTFLQILRDAFRAMDCLVSSNRFLGNFGLSSIAVVSDLEGNLRGKLVDFMPNGTAQQDIRSAARMTQRILDIFPGIDRSQFIEMGCLCILLGSYTEFNPIRKIWASTHHHPLFLDPNMRNLLRISFRDAIDYFPDPRNRCLLMDFRGCDPNCNWPTAPMDKNFRAVFDHKRRIYVKTIYGFLLFCRNSIVHLEGKRIDDNRRTKRNKSDKRMVSMEYIDKVLNEIWPGFIAAVFNNLIFGPKQLLVDEKSLR